MIVMMGEMARSHLGAKRTQAWLPRVNQWGTARATRPRLSPVTGESTVAGAPCSPGMSREYVHQDPFRALTG